MREAFLTGSATAAPTEEPIPAEIHLTKAKLENGGLYVEYTNGEGEGEADFTVHHKRPVHADLTNAFARLVPHLCLLCDLVQGVREGDEFVAADALFYTFPPGSLDLHERLEFSSFKVTGVTWSTTGVVLVGQKRYRSGKKVLNLVSPHEVLDPEIETGTEYEHLWELRGELRRFEAEVRLYLGGKSGGPAEVQGALDFDAASPLADILDEVTQMGKQARYTVTVGKGADAHELGKPRKTGKDAAAGSDD